MFWALLITVFVYRSLSWPHFLQACAKACKTTGVVLLLIGISAAFGYFMALYEVPQKTGATLLTVLRAGQEVVTPRGDLELEVGDHLLALGTAEQLESLERLATPERTAP